MATLPAIRRFLVEDFPADQQKWIGTLFFPLNLLLNTIYGALNNGLTVGQNMLAQIKTVPVSGSSPTVSFPYQFAPATPIGCQIINVVQTNSPAQALKAAVGCTFSMNAGVLSVTVQGLAASNTYNVTFQVIGG